jgi:hypothetical protein
MLLAIKGREIYIFLALSSDNIAANNAYWNSSTDKAKIHARKAGLLTYIVSMF